MNFAAEEAEGQKASDGAKVMESLDELSTMFRKYCNVFSAYFQPRWRRPVACDLAGYQPAPPSFSQRLESRHLSSRSLL
jgi:hypothetical protein